MNEEELLQLRRGVEAQFSWALKHSGDEELADLLRSEGERLSGIVNPPQSHNAPTLEPGNGAVALVVQSQPVSPDVGNPKIVPYI
jgi:hypothetical protein